MKKRLLSILVAVSFILTASAGFARDRITWMTAHWPPFMMLDDSGNITGGRDGIQLNLLQGCLKNYDHINREMPWHRFWYLAKRGDRICNAMVLKNPEREEVARFSNPINITLPNQVTMRKETFRQLGFPDALSLVTLMKKPDFKGLLIQSRSYSRDIDDLLSRHEKGSNISRQIVDELTLLKMLDRKRMDYTLEYPFVVAKTISKELPELKGRFVTVPIQEIRLFQYYYTACPDNEWGRAVIRDINGCLKKLQATPSFRNATQASFQGDTLRLMLKLYDAHILDITQ